VHYLVSDPGAASRFEEKVKELGAAVSAS